MGGVLRFGWSYKLEFPSRGHVICCANPGKSLDNMSVVFGITVFLSVQILTNIIKLVSICQVVLCFGF